jgi:hypothetical protein
LILFDFVKNQKQSSRFFGFSMTKKKKKRITKIKKGPNRLQKKSRSTTKKGNKLPESGSNKR